MITNDAMVHHITLPSAWMGFAAPRSGRACVRICGWCPDKDEADRLAKNGGCDVTHGMCKECYNKQLSERYGE